MLKLHCLYHINKCDYHLFYSKQDQCAANCMEKYLKMNQRISQRFQEFQVLANENAMAMMQKANK